MATHFNFQNLRGLLSAIPTLSDGQIYLATDTGGVYIGNSGTNVLIGRTIALETNGTPNGDQTKLNLVDGTNITITDDGTGDVTIAGPSALPPSGTAGGDLSGTYPNPSVAKVNGGSVPASQAFVGTDSSSHIVAATAGALPNGTTATTQTPLDGSTKVATDAYADAAATAAASGKQNTLTGTGIARNTGACTELSGDVTTSGSNAATVVKVNGGSVPASATIVGTNSSSQIVSLPTVPAANGGVYQSATADGGLFISAGLPLNVVSSGSSAIAPNGANECTVFTFVLPFEITVKKITYQITTGVAAATANFGIYSADGTSKLIDSGALAASGTSTVVTATITPVTLPAGVYKFVSSCSSASATAIVISTGLGSSTVLNSINQNVTRVYKATNTTSGGVLPSSVASVGSATSFGPMPLVIFES